MRYLLIFLLTITLFSAEAKKQAVVDGTLQNLQSPDGKLNFELYQRLLGDDKTQMYYTVTFNGEQVVLESELGILIENQLFESALGIENDPSKLWGENLELKSVDRNAVDETWNPIYGERSVVRDHYNEMVLHYSKFDEPGTMEKGHAGTSYDKRRSYQMDLIVRVYNEGVAFHYHFPETSNGLFLHIAGEQTSIKFQ